MADTVLSSAMNEMGRALHALRLEVPAPVADEISLRWSRLLDAIGDALTPDEVDPGQA
jgi:hypothetical protein